ncbi:MAG TPA: ABC transporter substrate-binding protein, partial [Vicinamibacteria bacterium]
MGPESQPQSQPRELMRQLTEGRLTRRAFIARAAALGFSASAIAGFLAACGGTTASPTSAPAAATTAPTAAATTAAATAATGPTAASGGASPAASPAATRAGSPAASPAAGGGGIGGMTTRPLGKGGGLGPGASKRGGSGTLKLLWWQAPTILNPHQAQGTKDYDASRITYEPLADFGPDDKMVPFLAAEIPTRENGGVAADGKGVTWKLKPGLKWSDGQPFTAKDVVFTWKYITDKETASVSAGYYQNIDKVEAPDDTTAKITFKEPTPGWYIPFTGGNGMILPEHVFKDGMGAAAKNFPANLKPVG